MLVINKLGAEWQFYFLCIAVVGVTLALVITACTSAEKIPDEWVHSSGHNRTDASKARKPFGCDSRDLINFSCDD